MSTCLGVLQQLYRAQRLRPWQRELLHLAAYQRRRRGGLRKTSIIWQMETSPQAPTEDKGSRKKSKLSANVKGCHWLKSHWLYSIASWGLKKSNEQTIWGYLSLPRFVATLNTINKTHKNLWLPWSGREKMLATTVKAETCVNVTTLWISPQKANIGSLFWWWTFTSLCFSLPFYIANIK